MQSIVLVLSIVLLGNCHGETNDFDIVRSGDRIESVAGFKFGSAPQTNGTTNVILKLDEPIRNVLDAVVLEMQNSLLKEEEYRPLCAETKAPYVEKKNPQPAPEAASPYAPHARTGSLCHCIQSIIR